MNVVVSEYDGVHAMPIVTLFRSRAKAEAFIVNEVMEVALDRREHKRSPDEIYAALKEYNAIFVYDDSGAKCTWWIQDSEVQQ